MTAFLLNMARAGLYLALFYSFYLLVMRRTTFFRLNRFLLLAGSYLCLLLPLVRLRTVEAVASASDLTMVAVGEEAGGVVTSAHSIWPMLLYVAGCLVTLALFGVSAWKMHRLIQRGEKTECEGCRLVILDEDIASFSWRNVVVMSRKDLLENPAILTHERMHIAHRHSLDLILFLPLQILFWWNPLMWITREELRLLHEYEADESVIQNGIDATQYQLLLVRKAVGEQRFTLASGFQHAKLKNRIEMMLKPSSSGWMRWSYLALIPVLAAFMFACNSPRKTEAAAPETSEPAPATAVDEAAPEQEAVPFQLIEVKPRFNGGDAAEFSKWVNSQLVYPEKAKQAGIQGRVAIQFTVGADGAVRDAKVLRGVSEDLDAEALRVVSSSPRWEPGMQDGKAVPVTFIFPVFYQLR
jgi:TonB family protein